MTLSLSLRNWSTVLDSRELYEPTEQPRGLRLVFSDSKIFTEVDEYVMCWQLAVL